MEKLNDLSFERLRLVNDYVQLSKQLDSYLTSARLNFSKAKTLHGVTLTGLADPDSVDLVAAVRINDSQEKYSIAEVEESSEVKARKPQKEEEKEEKVEENADLHLQKHSFRPFGVFEPMSAKEGRKMMKSAINIICDMANAQKEIKKIDEEMKATMEKVDIERAIECLKI